MLMVQSTSYLVHGLFTPVLSHCRTLSLLETSPDQKDQTLISHSLIITSCTCSLPHPQLCELDPSNKYLSLVPSPSTTAYLVNHLSYIFTYRLNYFASLISQLTWLIKPQLGTTIIIPSLLQYEASKESKPCKMFHY